MDNQEAPFGGRKVFELLMDSGEYLYVKPLSIFVVQALRLKAEELYPYPDKTEYERELDAAKAIEPGQKIPAEENPAYQKAYDAVEKQQSAYVNDQCIQFAVEPVIGKEAAIAKYAGLIADMRKVMDLPDDAWDATLRFAIICSNNDFSNIARAIQGNAWALPSEEEVLDGMRIFRPVLRQALANRSHPDEKSQSAESVNPAKA